MNFAIDLYTYKYALLSERKRCYARHEIEYSLNLMKNNSVYD